MFTRSLKFVFALSILSISLPAIAENLMDEEETPEVVPYFAEEMNATEEEPSIRRQEIEMEHDKKITAINAEQKEKRQEIVNHKQKIMNDRVMKTEPASQPISPRSRMINDQRNEESSNPFEPVIP